ncbi:MAG: VWA domain-containing protein [Chloroflexi bacterium]|nr:VWA domain-containing protein [Chloroflexota bacterium]
MPTPPASDTPSFPSTTDPDREASTSGDSAAGGSFLLENLLLFGQMCRSAGIRVTPERMIDVGRALAHVDLASSLDVYYTMRALMVTHPRDFALFEALFEAFWRRAGHVLQEVRGAVRVDERPEPADLSPDSTASANAGPATEPDSERLMARPTYSPNATLRHKNFGEMSAAELEQARRFIAQLPQVLPLRRTRRAQFGHGRQVDIRRSMRGMMRTGGDLVDLKTRKRRVKPRPIVLICDISGSMERYTRVLLHFTHSLGARTSPVESFVFSTGLTRITHAIRARSVEAALREVGLTVRDWGGGTRTGEALREFNRRWSRRVLGRGALVLLITDGWDRGDPELLRREIAHLARSCYRLIWLNPLIGSPGYEPLTRGAQTLLPYVDDFVPVRNLANLESLVVLLSLLRSSGKGRDAEVDR